MFEGLLFAQTATISKVIDIAPGMTTSLPELMIKNDANETIDIQSIKISLSENDGLKWDGKSDVRKISTQYYRRLGENTYLGDFNIGKYFKYTGIYWLYETLTPWSLFEDEDPVASVKGLKALRNGLTLVLEKGEENFNEWVISNNQGMRIINLPIVATEELENDIVQFEIELKVSEKKSPILVKCSSNINTFIPTSRFTGESYGHLSFKDSYGTGRKHNRSNTVLDTLEVGYLGSHNSFSRGDQISIRILAPMGGIRWKDSKNRIELLNNSNERILHTTGLGLGSVTRDETNAKATITFTLNEDVDDKTLKIIGLELLPISKQALIASFNMELIITSEAVHRIPITQKIMYGNPRITGKNKNILLYPDQEDNLLPDFKIIEDPKAALINARDGIILKLVNDVKTGQMVKPSVFWSNASVATNYEGTGKEKMLPGGVHQEGTELKLEVLKDFTPGDTLVVKGLGVTTTTRNEFDTHILFSFDDGRTFTDAFGEPATPKASLRIHAPGLVYNQGKESKYLYKGEPKSFGELKIKNMGSDSLFMPGDILLIEHKTEGLAEYAWNAGQVPIETSSDAYTKEAIFLSKNEIRLELRKPIPPGEQITLDNMQVRGFRATGMSKLKLSVIGKAKSPIAESASGIIVTTPTIHSLNEQAIDSEERIQQLSGFKLTRYSGLGFESNGVLLKLPDNMGLAWKTNAEYAPILYSNGSPVGIQITPYSDHEIKIIPNQKHQGTLYLYNLHVDTKHIASAAVDTGKIEFSFNSKSMYDYKITTRDKEFLRIIPEGDDYSSHIKKSKTISSNFDPDGEPVQLLLLPIGEDIIGNPVEFYDSRNCSITYSTDLDSSQPFHWKSSNPKVIPLKTVSALKKPGSFFIINNIVVRGEKAYLSRLTLGIAIQNIAGIDTVKFNVPLTVLASKKTEVGLSDRMLPGLVVAGRGDATDRAGREIGLVFDEIEIRNPQLRFNEKSKIRALSDANINNISVSIELANYEYAANEIDKVVRATRSYWLGYWLRHKYLATNKKEEDARLALETASKFGWVPSLEYPRHPELSKSPYDRGVAHFSKANNYYFDGDIWSADSVLTYLDREYLNRGVLEGVEHGEELTLEILKLSASVAEEYQDYRDAESIYDRIVYMAEDYDIYDALMEEAGRKADSLESPIIGQLPEIKLQPNMMIIIEDNPLALKSSMMIYADGMHQYPIRISRKNAMMNNDFIVQGGANYRLEPAPLREDIKRTAKMVLFSSVLLGVAYYNQGF
jgi:hypothetical protein